MHARPEALDTFVHHGIIRRFWHCLLTHECTPTPHPRCGYILQRFDCKVELRLVAQRSCDHRILLLLAGLFRLAAVDRPVVWINQPEDARACGRHNSRRDTAGHVTSLVVSVVLSGRNKPYDSAQYLRSVSAQVSCDIMLLTITATCSTPAHAPNDPGVYEVTPANQLHVQLLSLPLSCEVLHFIRLRSWVTSMFAPIIASMQYSRTQC